MGKKKAKKPVPKNAQPKVALIEFHDDEYLETAARLAKDKLAISTALIQKTLVVGYARAAHIIDRLEELHIIGGQDGAKPRRYLEKAPALKRKSPPTEKKEEQKKRGRGQPTIFTPEIALKICTRIAHGESLRQICKDEDMPGLSTIMDWLLDEEKQAFQRQYEKARALQAEVLFDELLEIADNSTNDWVDREVGNDRIVRMVDHEHVHRAKLRVDTRKWYISKVLPKKYGERLDVTSGHEKLKPARPAVINYVVPQDPAAAK